MGKKYLDIDLNLQAVVISDQQTNLFSPLPSIIYQWTKKPKLKAVNGVIHQCYICPFVNQIIEICLERRIRQ